MPKELIGLPNLQSLRDDICNQYKSKLKVSILVKWFKSVDHLKVHVSTFNSKEATETLNAQIEHMNLMNKALTGNNSPKVNKGVL